MTCKSQKTEVTSNSFFNCFYGVGGENKPLAIFFFQLEKVQMLHEDESYKSQQLFVTDHYRGSDTSSSVKKMY